MAFLRQNTGVGCLASPGIFPTQGLEPGTPAFTGSSSALQEAQMYVCLQLIHFAVQQTSTTL